MLLQPKLNIKIDSCLCPNLQRRRQKATLLLAGRRVPGGSNPIRGRPRSETIRKTGTPDPDPSLRPLTHDDQKVEAPSLGWMWQVGGGKSNGNSGGSQMPSAGPRPMPTAVSTVANLYEDRIKAKKSLGQNFLTDDGVLQDIVMAARVVPGDLVLEVGPGTGNLTKHLLAAGARVTAVEKDDTLYSRLLAEYRDVSGQLALVHGDVLKVGLEAIIRDMVRQDRPQVVPQPGDLGDATVAMTAGPAATPSDSETPLSSSTLGEAFHVAAPVSRHNTTRKEGTSASGAFLGRKVKVVANLPYNITKDLLLLLLPLGDLISDLHIMIQHEAAVRLTESTPGGPEWRAANIRTLFYCTPRYRFRISRLLYDPIPGVDGALVTFSLFPTGARLIVPSDRAFHALVNKAFSERRKKMRNSLQPLYSSNQVEAALTGCGLNVDARAQDLTLEQFVALHWHLHGQTVDEAMDLLRQPAPQEEVVDEEEQK